MQSFCLFVTKQSYAPVKNLLVLTVVALPEAVHFIGHTRSTAIIMYNQITTDQQVKVNNNAKISNFTYQRSYIVYNKSYFMLIALIK